MKIGVISSWNEMLGLFKYLNKFDHEYMVVYDFLYWPYGDKGFDFVLERIKKHIDLLSKQWVDKIIVPPVYELALADDERVMSLFQNYVLDHCFTGSLVGKIGLFWDFADIQVAQELFKTLEKKYKLSDAQKNIKKFQNPFAYRAKQVTMRKYYLTSFSYSDFMVNKQVKFDLKYFKDANVDTIIPLNYAYFHFEKTIKKFFNQKKTKFHSLEKLISSSREQLEEKSETYAVKIFYSWHVELLKAEKRIMWLLQRGKSINLEFVKMWN